MAEEEATTATRPRVKWRVDTGSIPPNDDEEKIHPSLRDMTEEQALARLRQMVDIPGVLQIITAECVKGPDCITYEQDERGRQVPVHDESDYPLTDHRHFVKHDVTHFDQDPRGYLRANTAEGDWTVSPTGARSMLRQLTRVSFGEG